MDWLVRLSSSPVSRRAIQLMACSTLLMKCGVICSCNALARALRRAWSRFTISFSRAMFFWKSSRMRNSRYWISLFSSPIPSCPEGFSRSRSIASTGRNSLTVAP